MPRKTDPKNLERVLDAAAELFLSEGYAAAPMQQLADRLGLHKSSLYHYVDTKEELLVLLTQSAQDTAEADLERVGGSADDGFLEAVSLATQQVLVDRGRTSLVLRQKPGSETGDAVVERRRAYDRKLSDLIEQGQQSGKLRDDIHPLLLSRLTLGMVSWLIEWYDPKLSRFSPEDVHDAVMAIVTNGVTPKD